MKQLILVGQIFGTSGYANHTRALFNALAEKTENIVLDVPKPQGWEVQVNDIELKAIERKAEPDALVIAIDMVHRWPMIKSEYRNNPFIGYVVWEGDKLQPHWAELLHLADKIVVPSKHVKESILNSTDQKYDITIIPHGAAAHFVPQKKPEIFTFLANKGWAQGKNDRGGLYYLLRAFSEEFKADEPVQLHVKVNPAYNKPGWNCEQEYKKLGLPAGASNDRDWETI